MTPAMPAALAIYLKLTCSHFVANFALKSNQDIIKINSFRNHQSNIKVIFLRYLILMMTYYSLWKSFISLRCGDDIRKGS